MKEINKIHGEYIENCGSRPLIFGKTQHWRAYYEGYEMGYNDAVKESLDSIIKELGMDLDNFPTNVDEQFNVMKEALQKYYKSQK